MAKKSKPRKFRIAYQPYLAIEAALLIRAGLTESQAAAKLKITHATWIRWKDVHELFCFAVVRAQQDRKSIKRHNASFHEFIYSRLPDRLQCVFDELIEHERKPNSLAYVQSLMEDQGEREQQLLYVQAMIYRNFQMTSACRMTGLPLSRIQSWIRKDPAFGELLEHVRLAKKDFFESMLVELVGRGDPHITWKVNSTVNADRGYSEKILVEQSGTVTHEHKHTIDLSQLDLPADVIELILESMEAKGFSPNAIETELAN